jgi:hypothetical protein
MNNIFNWFKDRAPYIATLILIFVIPLYPKFPLRSVGGTYVAIRLIDIIVGTSILICFISQALKGFPLLKSRIFKLFLIYWLVTFIANLSGLKITDTVPLKISFLHWLRRIEYMSLFFIGYQSIKTEKDLNDIKVFVGLALFGVFFFGFGQKYLHFPVISTMNEEFSKGILLYLDKWTRISSTFAGHYDLAAWLVMILVLIPPVVGELKSKLIKLITWTLGFLGLYLLILTASRVSFVAYLIGITVSVSLLRRFKWLILILGVSILMGLTSKELNARLRTTLKSFPETDQKIAQISDIWMDKSEEFYQQIDQIKRKRKKPTPTIVIPTEAPEQTDQPDKKTPTASAVKEPKEKIDKELRTWPTREEAEIAAARSSNIRFQVEWPRAVRGFLKNPLTGTGLSSLGLATDNDYLRLLGESGLVGFTSFMLIIFHLIVSFWRSIKNKNKHWKYSAGLIGVSFGILANAIYIDVFEASKVAFYFWLIMGIGYKLVNNNK